MTTPSGGGQINLLTNGTYSGAGGAAGHLTSASLGNAVYSYSASYDNDLRLVSIGLTNTRLGNTLFSSSRTYDAVGNVASVATALPQGTDHQLFCYDAQNRLTWAGTTSGNPCNNPAPTGSFGGASYTQAFSYDTRNRLTSGPLGSYAYGDSAHRDAATSVSSGYTATYDASGDMTAAPPVAARRVVAARRLANN